MAKILVVDDDPGILKMIQKVLKKDGHEVSCFGTTEEIDRNSIDSYDLLLLDVMMPGEDGFTFCREIRNMVDSPILFLTAKTMDMDLMEGFGAGADDYIKKPFSIVELRARVDAHLRREKRVSHSRLISGNLCFDLSARALLFQDQTVKLTKSEYDICEMMAKNSGQVFSLEQILVAVYGYDSESDNSAIREHIKNIRAKLGKYGESPIETVWGIGYRWKE
mgnify:CR=1 FL=1